MALSPQGMGEQILMMGDYLHGGGRYHALSYVGINRTGSEGLLSACPCGQAPLGGGNKTSLIASAKVVIIS